MDIQIWSGLELEASVVSQVNRPNFPADLLLHHLANVN
jgi:hypothetical protein